MQETVKEIRDVLATISYPGTSKNIVSLEDGTTEITFTRVPNSISFLAGVYLRTDFSFLIKRF